MTVMLCFEQEINAQWKLLGIQFANAPPATISDNSGPVRVVYLTECATDHASISKLPPGEHIDKGLVRGIKVDDLDRAELVKRLGIGDVLEMTLKPDGVPHTVHVRYRCVAENGAT